MKKIGLENEGHTSVCRMNIFAFLTLLFITLITYSNTFDASWHLDDGNNITENRRLHLKTFNWSGIRDALFSSPSSINISFFRPVSRLSLALNYYAGADNVFGYHVINLFIHWTASFFLYLFLFHTLRLPLLKSKYGPYAYFIALLSTVLWTTNPLQTQAVTYVVQRMACMAGMFYIMAMYFYVKGTLAVGHHAKLAFFSCSAFASLLSFGSKENAIVLPASLLLYHLLIVAGFSRKNIIKDLKIFSFGYLLPLALVLIFLAFHKDIITHIFGFYETRVFTLWERLLTESRVILFYMSLLLYPIPSRLSVDHDILISSSLFTPTSTILSVLFIIVVIVGVSLLSKKEPLITFSVLFFFINHVPESTILPMELIFEHRNYLPSMLFFVPIAIGFLKTIAYFSHNRGVQVLISSSLVGIIISMGHGTFMRNYAWKNEEILWVDCIEKNPRSFRAHQNLGLYYHKAGNYKNAISEYEIALKCPEIHSTKEKGITHFNLGLIAHKRAEHQRAIGYYSRALEMDPCCPGAHNNLAGLLLYPHDTNLQEVRQLLEKAVLCNHDTEIPLAYSNLGSVLMRMGKTDEAIYTLNKAMEIDPDNPLTLLRIAWAYKEKGRLGKASVYLKKLLNHNPGDITGFLCLAEIYVRSGHVDKAEDIMHRLVNTIPPEDCIPFLNGLLQEKSSLEVAPDINLLLPHLAKAYQSKTLLLQKNCENCLEAKSKMLPPLNNMNTDGK